MPESCVEIRHAILAKFHKPFFSNFSVVAKGLGLEAFVAGRFSCRKCQSPPSKFDTRSLQSFISHFFRTFLLLQRVWALRHLRLEGFLVGSARVLRRNSTRDPCKVSEAIFSNFSIVAKGLGFEAVTAGSFSCRKCQSPASEFDTRSLQSFISHFFHRMFQGVKSRPPEQESSSKLLKLNENKKQQMKANESY